MTSQLTAEQRQALVETAYNGPVIVVDPAGGRKYVLLDAAQDAVAAATWSHPDDAA